MKWSAKKQPLHSCSWCLFNLGNIKNIRHWPSLLPRVSKAQEASLDKWESFGRTLSSSTTTLVSRWVRRSTIWLKKCTNDPLHKIQKVKTIWRRNVDFTLRNPWGEGSRGRGSNAGICRICFGTLSSDFGDISLLYLNVQLQGFAFVCSNTSIAPISNNFLKLPTILWNVGEIPANTWN